MKKLMEYLRPMYGRIAVGMAIKFTGTIMDLLIPWALAYMIDTVVPQNNVPYIIIWGGIMILCSVAAVLGNVIANRMSAKVAREATRQIRHDLFSRISYLSCSQIDDYSVPSLVSRLTSDTYNVHHMISMMQRMGVRAPILLVGGIIVTLTLEPVLTLVLLAAMPFITVIVLSISRKGIPLYTTLQESVDKMVRVVRENASGIRVIKALSKEEYEKKRFAEINNELTSKEKKAGMTMAVSNPVMNLFLNLGLTAVIIVGAYRVNLGLTQPGKIIAFLSYFTIILTAMMSISRIFVLLSKGTASAARISKVLNTPEDMPVREMDKVDSDDHITFDHVYFSYGGDYDLEDIHFSLRHGETLGIIGATGCGKSTVIQLLMRLYDVDKGVIRINGQNIESIPPEVLHTMFGISFQNDILYSDTVAENIDFGRKLRMEQIQAAAAFAQAEEFISGIDKGYDHELTSRGTNLSGGQKQRLLIARALAAHPDILILDDSSSALDYHTDARLRKALRKNFKGTTSIIIAQRISSILDADHILYLEDGKVLGYGTHRELMDSCTSYRQIYDNQMGGARIG